MNPTVFKAVQCLENPLKVGLFDEFLHEHFFPWGKYGCDPIIQGLDD